MRAFRRCLSRFDQSNWPVQYRWKLVHRLVGSILPDEIHPCSNVRQSRGDDCNLPAVSQGPHYLLCVCRGTWLYLVATVPPTAGIVVKLFGTRYLATLFGLTLLTHQIGAFLGAWLGGMALARDGNYLWMWYADTLLAGFAAAVNLPIRENPVTLPSRKKQLAET